MCFSSHSHGNTKPLWTMWLSLQLHFLPAFLSLYSIHSLPIGLKYSDSHFWLHISSLKVMAGPIPRQSDFIYLRWSPWHWHFQMLPWCLCVWRVLWTSADSNGTQCMHKHSNTVPDTWYVIGYFKKISYSLELYSFIFLLKK